MRECMTPPVANGEHCYAIMLYKPPKRSKWRPRSLDCIPPMHLGKADVFFPRRTLAPVLADAREFNSAALRKMKPGKSVQLWAVVVTCVFGFEATIRILQGGAA